MRKFVLTVMVLLILGGGVAAYKIRQNMESVVNRDTFYDGITVDEVPLGGLTMAQARQQLEARNRPRLDVIQLVLSYEGREWRFGYEDMAGRVDYETQLQQAYEIGREGGLVERYKVIMALQQEGKVFRSSVTFDPTLVREQVVEIAEGLYQAPVDATMRFVPNGDPMFPITPEVYGQELDPEPVMAKVLEYMQQRRFADPIYLQPTVLEPAVKAASFAGKTDLIVSFGTDLKNSTENRRNNVYKGAMAYHGLVVMPGQIVSFNETTGPRGAANGYLAAPVIKADKSMEDEPGGGICQSSTTVYNAVLMAGLEIVERYHHSFPSSYVPAGLDATVNWGTADFRFKNNSNSPIYMRSYMANNYIFIEIYGEKIPNGVTYQLRSEVYETEPIPPTSYVQDTKGEFVTYTSQTYEKVKGRRGLKVRSYRDAYQNGKLIGSTLIANDYYKPIAPVIYVGTKAAPASVPASTN